MANKSRMNHLSNEPPRIANRDKGVGDYMKKVMTFVGNALSLLAVSGVGINTSFWLHEPEIPDVLVKDSE